MHLSARQRNENTSEFCLWTWEPGLLVTASRAIYYKPVWQRQGEQKNSSCFSINSTSAPSPCHQFPTTIHSTSIYEVLLVMPGTSLRAGDSVKSTSWPCAISPLPSFHFTKNEPLGTDMFLQYFLTEQKGDHSRFAQLEVGCANSPKMEKCPQIH